MNQTQALELLIEVSQAYRDYMATVTRLLSFLTPNGE